MQWSPEADEAIRKVPFFVRKKVRARVETEARNSGKARITLAEVKATQKRFLSGMASEVRGYQLDTCFGPTGCPYSISPESGLTERIEAILKAADMLTFLRSKGIRHLKFHHEFRVTVAECPNACSQPQIKDIGIIAARLPAVSEAACSECGACTDACRDNAIVLESTPVVPAIDMGRCMACGQCIAACPTETIVEADRGYRILLGGKLGRHPQLARELPGIYTPEGTLQVVKACVDLYQAKSRKGERFASVLTDRDIADLAARFSP